MTNAVAVIGLVWDGFDLQAANLDLMFNLTEGLDSLPVVRGEDQIIPFRSGRLAAPRMADRRPVVAVGWVAGSATAAAAVEYRAYLDSLKARLAPTRSAGLLVATLEDGSMRWINAVPRNLIGGTQIGSDFRAFSIEWEALDPFWYAANGSATMDSGLVMDNGEFMDQGSEIVITPATTTHAFSLDTQGTADVERIRIRMTGPSTAAVGIEVDTPAGVVGFVLADALGAGETFELDNYARTALIAAASQRAGMVLKEANQYGEYVRLGPGPNTIRILGKPAAVRLLFTPTYL